MRIQSVKYCEHIGGHEEWILQQFALGQTTLIVGRNAAGKSRVLNVINGLAGLISGKQRELFTSGSYDVEFGNAERTYRYQLTLLDRKVWSERLEEVGGRVLFHRSEDGAGEIWSEDQQSDLSFAIPTDVLTINVRRDRVQHPYLEQFHDWATDVTYIPFGTDLGRTTLMSLPDFLNFQANKEAVVDSTKLSQVYSRGFDSFAGPFDEAILADLERLGYPCDAVGMSEFNLPALKGIPILTLYVKERNLRGITTQVTMSQGMYRALGLVIHLNYIIFSKRAKTLLIDDIGEGLDFERSKSFVSLLIDRAEKAGVQLVMTTNDRFVMNDVDLKKWAIIFREGHEVRVINYENSPEIFKDFEFVGLNNFDFFAMDFFKRDPKDLQ